MGWSEYYEISEIQHLFMNETATKLIKDFLQNYFDPPNKFTALIGGTHPNSQMPKQLETLLRETFPSKNPNIILLDMNRQPLISANHPLKVQAKLENPPFSPSSLHLVYLDLTFDFMKPQQIATFGKSIAPLLAPEGIVISLFSIPVLGKFDNLLASLKNKVPIYCHKEKEIASYLLPHLKLIGSLETEIGAKHPCHALIFSRKDSFPQIPIPLKSYAIC